jgi:hypothetical protein
VIASGEGWRLREYAGDADAGPPLLIVAAVRWQDVAPNVTDSLRVDVRKSVSQSVDVAPAIKSRSSSCGQTKRSSSR